MATPEPDESMTVDTTDAPSELDDGGDVARDPDVIQREIEQTRAELADTIDAIADRISPKRAASRGAKAVKAQVASVFDRDAEDAPASVLDAPADGSPADRESGVRAVAASGGSQFTGTTEYGVSRSLRTDRVLIIVGVSAAIAALIVIRRSRS